MQTFNKQKFETQSVVIVNSVEDLARAWHSQLTLDYPNQSELTRESIVRWLLGKQEQFERLNPLQRKFAQQAIAYRYRILRQRYLGVAPERAYRHLISRLGGIALLRNKIRTWASLSRDRQRPTIDILQEAIQELLQNDRYLQQEMIWIAECTEDHKLRNALLLASTEEYCLRPIRNQPLLVYRIANYLRRANRGGLTQVPIHEAIQFISEGCSGEDGENPISLLDNLASAEYQEAQELEAQYLARSAVKQEFELYLASAVGTVAVQWLHLYLQGQSQYAIAENLKISIKEVYRLREKVCYHAIRIFALKQAPELVSDWLETSLEEHNFGLTPLQWQQFWEKLTLRQRQMIHMLRNGKNVEAVAIALKLKANQVKREGQKCYLAAQALRACPTADILTPKCSL